MKYDHIKAEAGKRDMNRIIINRDETSLTQIIGKKVIFLV